jgi:hypothetical protein
MARSGGSRRQAVSWLGIATGLLAIGLFASAATEQQLAGQINSQAAQRAHGLAQTVSESSPPTGSDTWLVEPGWCPPVPGTAATAPSAQGPDQCEAPGRSIPAAPIDFDAPINTLAAVVLDNRVARCEQLNVGGDYVLCAAPAPGSSDQAVVVASPLAATTQRALCGSGVGIVLIAGAVLLGARVVTTNRR